MKNAATVKPTLYKHKKLKDGRHPVILQIIKDRKVKRISLGYSAFTTEWDFKKNQPSKKHPDQMELQAVISKKISDYTKQVLELDRKTDSYTADHIVTTVKRKASTATVVKYFDAVISDLKAANKIGNAEVYTLCRNQVSKFNNERDIRFSQIDYSWLTKFENACIERGCKKGTVSNYLRTLRALFNRAIKEKLLTPDIYPFKEYRVGKLKTATQKRALKVEQIAAIENAEVEYESRLWHSRNLFLFSYYTIGTNLADLASLTWVENIKGDRIVYERAKTKKLYNIVLTEKAFRIVDYYQTNRTDKYVFPIYSEDAHKTAEQRNNRLHKVMRQTNNDLRDIAALCGIAENVTTYVARHSAATILKRKGVSTAIISEILGHDSEETTQIYLDSFSNEVIDTAISML